MSGVTSHVKLVQTTRDAEGSAESNMAYIARVSNPKNQETNANPGRLLRYCINHHHWSVFEHSFMTLEITTTTAIATQLLRHRSFTFQQFSQRYANPVAELQGLPFAMPDLRMQDHKNRQNSLDTCPEEVKAEFRDRIAVLYANTLEVYSDMIKAGIAKECARGILPQSTLTRVEMSGNCRSWIHYIQLRTAPETQKEHREVAEMIKLIFCSVFPLTAEALGWVESEQ